MQGGVLQNRTALDIVTIAQGRMCTLIGKGCCMYVPDPEAIIIDLMSHKQKTITQVENLSFVDSLAMWLNLLPRRNGGTMLLSALFIVLGLLLFCCSLYCCQGLCLQWHQCFAQHGFSEHSSSLKGLGKIAEEEGM